MSTIDTRQHAVKSPAPRSAAGEAFNDVLMLVLRLNGSFTAAGEALARPAGQTLARWVILDQCRAAPATVSDISRQLRQARQSVQRIADLLVADGQCSYQDNPHHQRAKLLDLTPAGRAALNSIDAAQHRWCDTLGEEIGEAALRRAAAALQRITGAVEAAPPAAPPGRS
jgi:DNA-binding MarR family transcriptional regulator